MNRTIQVPIDEPLLEALDEASDEQGTSRSALIRAACREFLRLLHERKLDEQYVEGYRRIPDDPAVGEAQLRMLAEVLPEEEW